MSPDSGATSLPHIGTAFMYIETSLNNNSENVFVSFGRTDNIQITNITFYYNGFSYQLKSNGQIPYTIIDR